MRGADYVVKRVGFAVATVLAAATINFFLFRVLPGSAVTNLAHVPGATAQLRHLLVVEFGLDRPKWEQFFIYLGQLAHGNLGVSFINQQPVTANLGGDLANTIPVVAIATVLSLVVGIVAGLLSACRRGSWLDHISTNVAIVLYAFPTQWIALTLLIFFAGALPTAGMSNPFQLQQPSLWQSMVDYLRHAILPILTLVLTLYGGNVLIVRSALLDTLGEDYVLTARAKGLSPLRIVRSHALRNAMLPITTLVTLSLGYVVAGAILVEVVFSWPGIGTALYNAVLERDYPMLQGIFLVLTISVVFFNTVADLVYFKLDPRVAR
ncbi:MAG TPA: ABC transporter permease [Verrucomicrobiae bacterium]|nr:ABC transporter permease [Verrucomicrobiae bacterium]